MKKINDRQGQILPSSDSPDHLEVLHKIAEERVREKEALLPVRTEEIKSEEIQDVIHSLMVHQIELEMQNDELRRLQMTIDELRARYFDIYDLAPVGYLILSEQGIIQETNLTAANMLATERRDLINHRISPYIIKEDQTFYYSLRKALFASSEPQECEVRMVRKDGTLFWAHVVATLVENEDTRIARITLSDITKHKKEEQELAESEEKYRLLCTSMNQGLALCEIITDEFGMPVDFVFLDINDSLSNMFGLERKKTVNRNVKSVLPAIDQSFIEALGQVAITGEPLAYENYQAKSGKFYSVVAYSPKRDQFAALVYDVTDRIKREDKIKYLSYHDQLTGLYNRRFYEEELRRLDTPRDLPLTIVMSDLNGLKLINDSFGHLVGDELLKKAAGVIKRGCRAEDIVSRFGGDEFVVILPQTDAFETERLVQRIKNLAAKEKINDIDLSISFGYETKISKEQDIHDVFKIAEDHMYRHKLIESSTIRKKIINVIVNMLFEKDVKEMMHAKHVSAICSAIASEMDLTTEDKSQIKLAGLMHDIGKIGVDESILKSPDKPSKTAWKEIKRHSEIGYRILSSSTEFSEIAVFILDHHERWDGKGYPKRLRGEEIPLASRIIAIAEAFDVMTSEHEYGVRLDEKEAAREIQNGSGKQFDPEVVEVFIEKVLHLFEHL